MHNPKKIFLFIPVVGLLLEDTCVDLAMDLLHTFFKKEGSQVKDDFSDFPKLPEFWVEEEKSSQHLVLAIVFAIMAVLCLLLTCFSIHKYRSNQLTALHQARSLSIIPINEHPQLGQREVLEPESYASLVQNERSQLAEAEIELERVTISLERAAIQLEREQNDRESREQEAHGTNPFDNVDREEEVGDVEASQPFLADELAPAPLATDL